MVVEESVQEEVESEPVEAENELVGVVESGPVVEEIGLVGVGESELVEEENILVVVEIELVGVVESGLVVVVEIEQVEVEVVETGQRVSESVEALFVDQVLRREDHPQVVTVLLVVVALDLVPMVLASRLEA